MGTVISNLKARFGVDTSDFKKGLKDGDKAVGDFTGAAGDTLDKFASMFGINMSAVNDSVNTAFKSINFLGQSFIGAAKGSEILTIAMKVLKFALISTGIGAIIVGLGSLIAYFQKTGEGADKFAKILAQVKSVVNNVIDRLAIFGKGLSEILSGRFAEGWETMRGAFKGIGNEIKEDWKAAGALADREEALEDKEIALISSLEERRAKVAELRRLAKEELEDNKKKVDLIKQAEALIKSVYGDELGIERERLAIMKEKLAIQTKDPTDEQRREIAEQEAKINSLLREQSTELKGLLREKNAALKIVNEEIELEKIKAEQVGITKALIDNIKLPDFNQITSNVLVPLEATKRVMQGIKEVTVDMSETLSDTFSNITVGFSEMVGNLAAGGEGMRGWGTKLVGNTFGDMLINLGKVAIATGMGIEAIKVAFKTLGGIGAIIAGSALIALGMAIKTTIASTFSSSSAASSGSTDSGKGFIYDTRAAAQSFKISGSIELVARGPDLAATLELEKLRKDIST